MKSGGESDLKKVIENGGVSIEQKDGAIIGCCPFCSDGKLTIQGDSWHCSNNCQGEGTLVDWVMKFENVSRAHAQELLKRDDYQPGETGDDVLFDAEDEEQDLLNSYVLFCHRNIEKNPEALKYLEKRGLIHNQLLSEFMIGYSNRSLGYLLPEKSRRLGKLLRGKLQRIGILRSSGHEHFSGSVIFPLFNQEGEVVQLYGRKIRDDLRTGTEYHTTLDGHMQGFFNFKAITGSEEFILCQGIIDALSLWVHNIRNVTACFDAAYLGDQLIPLFKESGVKRLTLAFARNDRGAELARTCRDILIREGFDCYRMKWPGGMDANEFMVKSPSPAEELQRAIKAAEWLGSSHQGLGSEGGQVSVFPPAPAVDVACQEQNEEIVMVIDDRRWRVRGLYQNTACDQLKVNLLVACEGLYYVDALNLYHARQRYAFIRQAASELQAKEETIKKDLGKVLLKLEELQDAYLKEMKQPKEEKPVEMSPEEEAEALRFLSQPDLLDQILRDFDACGLVGETTNKLMGYLAAVSRKLSDPLAVIVQSSSSAGKTRLMDSILALVPKEDRIKYSAMTGQSLYYLGEKNLKHKILAIVEEEGAEKASYALKLLQSEGELSIATTGKDAQSGRMVTREYKVEGPVMIFTTTTGIDIDEELQNRCIILTVDESREQTREIHRLQRQQRSLTGLEQRHHKPQLQKKHQNAQRLLKSFPILNPYAEQLTFLDDKTRTRRDHEKYLTLIDTITLLYQAQREKRRTEYGEFLVVSLQDIEMANQLAHEVLGRSLDELPPQTRRLLQKLDLLVEELTLKRGVSREAIRFSRRDIRRFCGLSMTQVNMHVRRLLDHEYLLRHPGERGKSHCYELLFSGEGSDGKPFLPGLIDVQRLKEKGYDGKRTEGEQEKTDLLTEKKGMKWPENGLGTPHERLNITNEQSRLIERTGYDVPLVSGFNY